MKDIQHEKLFRASEVKLSYVTKTKPSERIKINNAQDAVDLFHSLWDKSLIEFLEEVKIMLLNRNNQVIGIGTLSQGGLTGSLIDIRVILQYALKSNACAVILAHNHPSGNLEASEADMKITQKVRDGLRLVDIELLDHIIIRADKQFKSIMDYI